MKAYGQHRFWGQAVKYLILAGTVATAVILMSPGGLEAKDLSVTTHDGTQTTQHNDLSSQITNVQTAVDNLSSSGDHSGLPQAWDKTLPGNDPGGACPSNSSRFTCVMGGTAVRDNETGLVWEQSPLTAMHTWDAARIQCTGRAVGGRKGWRLPSVHELASLVDPSVNPPDPTLPAGHPFTSVQQGGYWSATTNAGDLPDTAWGVEFERGLVAFLSKTGTSHVWCVRGVMNADAY